MNQTEVTVKVASTVAEINTLRDFWTRLNYHPEADIDFVLMLVSVRSEIQKPYILVAYNSNEEPIALMVGRVERALANFRIGYFTLFRIPLTQLVFVRDGCLGDWSESIVKAIVEKIGKALDGGDADRALLCSLSINGILHNHARKHFHILQRDYSREIGEHWITNLPSDFDAFLMRKSKKRRTEFRRTIRIFEDQYKDKVKYGIFSEPHEVDMFCNLAETVAMTTYQRGLGAGFYDNVENRERLTLAAHKGCFRAYIVFVGDKPLAFESGERVGDAMYLLWTGYDPAYRKFEVGTIVFMKMIEDLIALGVKEIDYGPGGAQYKERYGNQCLREQDIDIYAPTLNGYGIHLTSALNHIINRAGKRLITQLKISEKVKKIWRANLAAKAKSIPKTASKIPSGYEN